MIRSAVLDSSQTYRYSLERIWYQESPSVTFIMLNPSTADHQVDDPTVRRCINFAKSWGFGAIEVVNLFAFRSTYPEELHLAGDPIGPDNDSHILKAVEKSSLVVAAWGTKGTLNNRNKAVLKLLAGHRICCLDITQSGHPKHPLYIKGSTKPSVYKFPGEGL